MPCASHDSIHSYLLNVRIVDLNALTVFRSLPLQNIANRSVIMKVAQMLLALVGGPPTTAHDTELFVLLI
jgi:hypothetical protein